MPSVYSVLSSSNLIINLKTYTLGANNERLFAVSRFRRTRNVQKIQSWIVGLGAIGLQIARTIDQGNLSNFDLVAIATRDEKKAAKNLETLTIYQISLP